MNDPKPQRSTMAPGQLETNMNAIRHDTTLTCENKESWLITAICTRGCSRQFLSSVACSTNLAVFPCGLFCNGHLHRGNTPRKTVCSQLYSEWIEVCLHCKNTCEVSTRARRHAAICTFLRYRAGTPSACAGTAAATQPLPRQ